MPNVTDTPRRKFVGDSDAPMTRLIMVVGRALALSVLAIESHARDVGDFGVRGGGEFRITCEPGDFLVGFDVQATRVIGRIAPVCGDRKKGGTYERPWIGGRVGLLHKLRCQPGAILTMLHVFADKTSPVNRLGFTCWHPDTGAVTNGLPNFGGVAGDNRRLICPPGEMATGVYGRAGTAIDRLGLICEKRRFATPAASVSSVPAEWADMLNAHNEKRRVHCAPPLVWSQQLADEAQAWANKCTNTHGVSSGENLAFFHATLNGTPVLPAKSDRGAFQDGWYCEVKQYAFNNPRLVGGFTSNCAPPTNGHFTQVVWKGSQQLGCGRATCTIGGAQGTYWVCRYGPGGNNHQALTKNVRRASCN